MVHAHKYAIGISVQLNYRNDLQDGRAVQKKPRNDDDFD